ncbi:MAG: hypothetical protein AVDCRST_MAG93-9147, partial [uncultured Chloroflexia bacterium]
HAGHLVTEFEAGALEGRRHRSLLIDTVDRDAASYALTAAGFTPGYREDGLMELRDERAIAHPDEVARTLVRADVPPTHLSVHQEDLETYFLRLVTT